MTLCLALTTADGIVMATDSTALVRSALVPPTAYDNAEKIFQLLNLPIGVMVYGAGALGTRTVGSIISEWNEENLGSYSPTRYTVEGIAADLSTWFFQRHKECLHRAQEALKEEDPTATFDPLRFNVGLVVGGFHPGKGAGAFFPHLYEHASTLKCLTCVRPHDAGDGPDPGVDFWGLTGVPERLLYGVERDMLQEILRNHGTVLSDNDLQTLQRFIWPVAWEGIPLQDAVELTEFLMTVAMGYERFKAGIPLIGGEAEILVIARNRTHWVRRKPLSAALASYLPRA